MQQTLDYLLAIHETGSIRKAAGLLNITQPALSIALRKVEEELGSPLFDRGHHPLELTAAGRVYMDGLLQIRQIEQNVRTEISDLAGLCRGSLSIGGTLYFTSYVLPPVLFAYSQQYPKVDLRLSEADTPFNAGKLLNNQLDLILSTHDHDPGRFDSYPVSCDLLLLCVPVRFVRGSAFEKWAFTRGEVCSGSYRSREPLPDLSLLRDVPFILLQPESGIQRRSLALFQDAGFFPKDFLRVEQLVTSYYLSCQQVGAAFVTDTLICKNLEADVRYFRLNSPSAARTIYVVAKKDRYLSNAARQFIALCSQKLPHQP